jgi:uncharacterized membrane protein YfcA
VDPAVYALAAIVLFAGFVQGATGFGFGLVVMAVFPLLLSVPFAVPLVGVLGFVLNPVVLWRYRGALERSKLWPLALGGAVGTPIGIAVLRSTDPTLLRTLLGVILCAYALHGLLGRDRGVGARAPGGLWGVAAGAAGGMLSGAFNTGGPPAIVYAHLCGWTQQIFKATLQAFFLITTGFQVTLFASLGMITRRHLELDALLLGPMLLGVWIGIRASDRLDRERFRNLVLVALLVMGAVFVVRAVA